MASRGEIDILFDMRNNYYIGAYQGCINEAQNLKTRTESEILLTDIFLYRAYIALNKFSIPMGEIIPLCTNIFSAQGIGLSGTKVRMRIYCHQGTREKIKREIKQGGRAQNRW